VHLNAGTAGLVAAMMLGKRKGLGTENFAPHNLAYSVIGASLLWVGWFGFNAGSAVEAHDGAAGMAAAATQIATAAAALAWMVAEWIVSKKPTLLGMASGAVAGLVAVTPASGFVNPNGALVIGVAAGVGCYLAAVFLKRALKYDDSLDAFGVHCIGGIVGALLTGALVSKEISGSTGSVLLQLRGVVATLVWSFVVSIVILKLIDMTIGLRVSAEEEREGLDITQHGEALE
jgi:Amt family ammonium transporter